MTAYSSWSKTKLIEHIRSLEATRSVESSVLAVVEGLAGVKKVSAADRARAELALSLAKEIDSPTTDKPAPAQLSKELRALLDDLELVTQRGDSNSAGVFPSLGNPSAS